MRWDYESAFLNCYKRFLKTLENTIDGNIRNSTSSVQNLVCVAVQCLSNLLIAKPHFNYASNIATTLVPLMNSRNDEVYLLVYFSWTYFGALFVFLT